MELGFSDKLAVESIRNMREAKQKLTDVRTYALMLKGVAVFSALLYVYFKIYDAVGFEKAVLIALVVIILRLKGSLL
jgi:hypothetical protein